MLVKLQVFDAAEIIYVAAVAVDNDAAVAVISVTAITAVNVNAAIWI